MRKLLVVLAVLLVVFMASIWLVGTAPAGIAADWETKVDPWVMTTARSEGQTEFLVYLDAQADLSGADALTSKLEKGTYVYERLTEIAARTQPAVTTQLDALGVTYRPYWVVNAIWVRADLSVVQAMASRADVAHIYANPTVKMEFPAAELLATQSPDTIEWNILKVQAPDVWAAGVTGQGAVIGGQDTGYDWTHPALQDQYRGWNGVTADHNYQWHDAIHSGGGVCGPNSSEPCDDHSHGTHTMGTMVGDDGGSNQIGMAPGARWIGCRNMDQGNGTPTTYMECYQWFIAPTDLNNQNPDPAMAPDVINNSWGCPVSEGCTDPNILLSTVQAVRAAGIVTVHSAGNSGSGCSSVDTPSAIYDESFSVGSTTSTDAISSFSSRGPVTVDGSNRLKPDISAPGSSVRSSVPGGGYSVFSGTSMAGPHVAGLVGLIVSAEPSLAGNVAAIETLIQDTAVQLTSTQECGGIPGSQIPNNTFGYGRINALAAYNALFEVPHTIGMEKTASATSVMVGDVLTYTLAVSHSHPTDPTYNVIITDVIPAGTTLVTATLPFTQVGDEIRWDLNELAANDTWAVQLVVQVTGEAGAQVINSDYGVRSDEVAFVGGPPVSTDVIAEPTYEIFLPFLHQ